MAGCSEGLLHPPLSPTLHPPRAMPTVSGCGGQSSLGSLLSIPADQSHTSQRGNRNLGYPQGSQEVRTLQQDGEVGEFPRASQEELRDTEEGYPKASNTPHRAAPAPAPTQQLQALKFKGFLLGCWSVSQPFLGSLPPSLSSFLCSIHERWEEGCRGRWQDPARSSGLSPAFVAMATLLFLSRCS